MFHIYQNLCLSCSPDRYKYFLYLHCLFINKFLHLTFENRNTTASQYFVNCYFSSTSNEKKKLAYLANQSRTKVQFFHAHSVLLWNENNSILNFPSYNKWPRRKNHRSRRIRTPRTPIPCAHAYLCSIIHIRAVY